MGTGSGWPTQGIQRLPKTPGIGICGFGSHFRAVKGTPRDQKREREMPQRRSEPCKKEACDIQACLSKNNFMPQKCIRVIELLQLCCEKCNYKSTHCASVSDLLKQKTK